MALAYLLGKGSSKILKVKMSVPVIVVLAIIPDIDVLFEPLIRHRGPTHSLITALLVFIPFFVLYRKKALPYFIALISHSLIGDFLVGGSVQLLWPLSRGTFGLSISITSYLNIALELSLFAFATYALFKTNDYRQFLLNKKTNLILIIPIITVLLPSIIGFPLAVPLLLIPPHLFYLVLFSISVLIVLVSPFKKRIEKRG